MITTVYKCDRCGHEQAGSHEKPRQLWTVSIAVNCGPRHRDTHASQDHRLWCRECMIQTGALNLSGMRPDPSPVPMPSFEDRFRELLRELAP